MTLPEAATVAEPERRFQAFAIDRAIAWSLYAAAGVTAWWCFFRDGRVWPGLLIVLGTVAAVGTAFAVQAGLRGTTPGKRIRGLRIVDVQGGGPIGVGRSLLRSLIVGVSSLPMFGLGLATLSWTAVEDRTRERRGWHDHVTGSVVIDVRPKPAAEVEAEDRPRHVVNLTAMRLVPVREPVVPVVPAPQVQASPEGSTPSACPQHSGPVAPPRRREPSSLLPPGPAGPTPPATPPLAASTPVPPGAAERPVQGGGQPVADAEARRPLIWRVSFDSGESFVVEGLGIVGRAPTARPGEPVRHVVPLSSADMSISKTHAQIHLASDGALVLTDRGSTNGSILVRKGVSRELAPGRPTTLVDGDRVVFGDRSMHVTREDS
jgi:uncharacterized RDD family membrane protein YckC